MKLVTLLAILTLTLAARAQQCVTRTADYWFSNPANTDPNCATLLKAIEANGGQLDLGFICLPLATQNDYFCHGGDENGDSVIDAKDALWEANGLYWKKLNQSCDGSTPTDLCKARKVLAVQLIAAIANHALLGADPATCGSESNLLEQARQAAACDDLNAIDQFTKELDTFNKSGAAEAFPDPLHDCRANPRGAKAIAVDHVLTTSCNGTANCAAGAACP